MNKILLFLTIFSFGYVTSDLLRDNKINLIGEVKAEVAGMDSYDLRYDYDFKRAVRKVVEKYCEVEFYGDIDC